MKIEFTAEQFQQLLKITYLGRWMVSAHHDDPDTSMEEVEQVVYSHAKNVGLSDLIDFDLNNNKYLPSDQLEEEMEPVIQEYDDFTFWDQLAWQMAERDFARKFDQSQILCMTDEETFREKNILADRYFDEFAAHGVENLDLLKS
ncbi:MAG TPA: hypothetical protein VIH57_01835 [Bacteroidales bacterium]